MSSGLGGISSSLSTQSQSDQSASISIPANLTPQQEAQVQQILSELASGAITPAQAQGEIASILTPQQQTTLQNSLQSAGGSHHAHHGHHGKHADSTDGTSPQPQTLSAALNLTTDQESEIASIIQQAQTNGSTPAAVLSQIEGVLTPSQQQQLAQMLSPTYSSVGTTGNGSQPPLFSTTA